MGTEVAKKWPQTLVQRSFHKVHFLTQDQKNNVENFKIMDLPSIRPIPWAQYRQRSVSFKQKIKAILRP